MHFDNVTANCQAHARAVWFSREERFKDMFLDFFRNAGPLILN